MAFAPVSFIIPEYDKALYANWWLKAYTPGTTTPKTMATDSTGATTASRFELNAQGFPITAGNALVVPHVDGDYDIWLFPTAAEADANDTDNALQFADNLGVEGTILSVLNSTWSVVFRVEFTTNILTDITSPLAFETDYYNSVKSVGSGAKWVKTGNTGTPGTTDFANRLIYNGNGDEYVFGGELVTLSQLGCIGDDTFDNSAALIAAVANNTTLYVPEGTYAIKTNTDLTAYKDTTLIFAEGAVFNIDVGVQLILNQRVEAGSYKIFNYTFDPQQPQTAPLKFESIAALVDVDICWFGAVADATFDSGSGEYIGTDSTDGFDKALGVFVPDVLTGNLGGSDIYRPSLAGTVKIPPGQFLFDGSVQHSLRSLTDLVYYTRPAVNIHGSGKNSTILFKGNRTTEVNPLINFRLAEGPWTEVTGFKVTTGNASGSVGRGLQFDSCNAFTVRDIWVAAFNTGFFVQSCADFDLVNCLGENSNTYNFYIDSGSPRMVQCSCEGDATDSVFLTNTTCTITDLLIYQILSSQQSGIHINNTTGNTARITNLRIEGGDNLDFGILVDNTTEAEVIASNVTINNVRDCGIQADYSRMMLSNVRINNVAQGITKGPTRAALHFVNKTYLQARNISCNTVGGEAIRGIDFYHMDVDGLVAENCLSFISGYVFFIQNKDQDFMGGNTRTLISLSNVQLTGTSNAALNGLFIDSESANVHFTNIDFNVITALGNAEVTAGGSFGGLSTFSGPHSNFSYNSNGAVIWRGSQGSSVSPFPNIYGTDELPYELQIKLSGSTGGRPTLANNAANYGFMYTDTTIGKPVWWINGNWLDATGTPA